MAGGTERRDRTTTVALQTSAQNGTSDVLAECKHAWRLAGLATPRNGASRMAVPDVPPHAADATGRVQLAGGAADITTVLVVKIDVARGVRKPARGDGARDAR